AVARVDERVLRRASVDLLTEFPDEHVDRTVAVSRAASPDTLEELVAREHSPMLARERVQESELRRCQLRARPVHVRLDVVGVEAQLLDVDAVAAPWLGVADPAP